MDPISIKDVFIFMLYWTLQDMSRFSQRIETFCQEDILQIQESNNSFGLHFPSDKKSFEDIDEKVVLNLHPKIIKKVF